MLGTLRSRLAQWIAPKAPQLQNRYEGAWPSPSLSFLPGGLQPARADISSCSRRELSRKSRYFERNDALFNRLLDLAEQHVVGLGIIAKPASSSEEFNQAAAEYWFQFSRAPDIGSRLSFGTLQTISLRSLLVDGECFWVKTFDAGGNPKLQFIEADLVATPPDQKDDRNLSDGVVLDDYGQPTGYWIGTFNGASEPVTYKLVPAEFVIHLYEPGRFAQFRGLPIIYPTLNELHHLSDLLRIELEAAKDNSAISRIITTPTGELSLGNIRKDRFSATPAPTTGAATCPPTAREYYEPIYGARATVLRAGDTYAQFPGQRPAEATRELWDILSERICTGFGIPYLLAVPDRTQGTVFRGVLRMGDNFFRGRFAVMAAAIIEAYEYVIEAARNKVPALRDPPSDWRRISMTPPASISVDIGRDSAATLNEVKAGTKTLREVFAEDGKDYLVERRQRAFEISNDHALAEEFGISVEELTGEPVPDTEAQPLVPGATPADQTGKDEEITTEEAVGAATQGADVQSLALNGAQLAAVQEFLVQVANKQLPAEAAKLALHIALPVTDPKVIDAMVDAAAAFTPEEEEAVPAA